MLGVNFCSDLIIYFPFLKSISKWNYALNWWYNPTEKIIHKWLLMKVKISNLSMRHILNSHITSVISSLKILCESRDGLVLWSLFRLLINCVFFYFSFLLLWPDRILFYWRTTCSTYRINITIHIISIFITIL